MIVGYLASFAATLFIETAVAVGIFRRPDLARPLIAVNFCTHPALHLILFFVFAYSVQSYVPILIILEAVIIFGEAFLLAFTLKRGVSEFFALSAIANTASFLAGEIFFLVQADLF